jgi:hypothetical protein
MSNFRPWKPRYKETILMQLCVKAFMKIKLKTSEWRNDFESEEEYKRAVKENLGIELGKIEIILERGYGINLVRDKT